MKSTALYCGSLSVIFRFLTFCSFFSIHHIGNHLGRQYILIPSQKIQVYLESWTHFPGLSIQACVLFFIEVSRIKRIHIENKKARNLWEKFEFMKQERLFILPSIFFSWLTCSHSSHSFGPFSFLEPSLNPSEAGCPCLSPPSDLGHTST